MGNIEVGWDAKYDIEIKGIGADVAHNLASALRGCLAKVPSFEEDTVITFDKIIEICDHISQKDDED